MTVAELLESLAKAASEPNEIARTSAKCRFIDELGARAITDPVALDAVVAALADRDGYDAGSYDYAEWESVSDHAMRVLVRVGAPAEQGVAALLAHESVAVRALAANVLQGLRVPYSQATLAALIRCAADPDLGVRRAVGQALLGTAQAAALLDDPNRRSASRVDGTPSLAIRPASRVPDADREVRVLVLNRLRYATPVLADASRLITCLADPDLHIAREAAAALGTCAPDDPRATAALYAASQGALDEPVPRSEDGGVDLGSRQVAWRTCSEAGDKAALIAARRRAAGDPALAYAALIALAERPSIQLVAFATQLVAWFCSSDTNHDEVAFVLGALGIHATPQIAAVLANRLATLKPKDERPYHIILTALVKLGQIARATVPAIEALASHPKEAVREHALAVAALISNIPA